MQYMLLIHSSEAAMQSAPQDAIGRMHAAYMAYTEAIDSGGRCGERQPPAAGQLRRPRSASLTARPRCSTARMPKPRSSLPATT